MELYLIHVRHLYTVLYPHTHTCIHTSISVAIPIPSEWRWCVAKHRTCSCSRARANANLVNLVCVVKYKSIGFILILLRKPHMRLLDRKRSSIRNRIKLRIYARYLCGLCWIAFDLFLLIVFAKSICVRSVLFFCCVHINADFPLRFR